MQSLKKNYISNLLLRITQILIPLITFPYVSRILQPELLGRVTFAQSFVYYLVLLTQLGTPVYGIRACARVRDDREMLSSTVCELMMISICMAAVSCGILAVAVCMAPRIENDKVLFIIFSLEIIANAVCINWMFEGLEQYSYIAVRTAAVRLLSAFLIFFVVRKAEHYLLYAVILVSSTVLTQLINLIFAGKYINFHLPEYWRAARHLKQVLVFFAMAGATAIYTSLDKVMLGFMAGNTAVGCYTVAVKIRSVLYLCVTSLAAVLLPRSSYYIEKGKLKEFRELSGKALNYVIVTAVPLAAYFFLFAREAVLFLSGEAFLPAVLPMRIIMPSMILMGMSNLLTVQVMIPLGKEKLVLYSNIAGAVTDGTLNLLLIPRYGAAGAAVGTLIAEVGVFITLLKGAGKDVDFRSIQYWKIAVAVIAGSVAAQPVCTVLWNSVLKLFISATLFFGTTGIVLLLLKEKLAMEMMRSLFMARFPSLDR